MFLDLDLLRGAGFCIASQDLALHIRAHEFSLPLSPLILKDAPTPAGLSQGHLAQSFLTEKLLPWDL